MASWNLFRNFLRNPVEPDLALHQSLPDLHRKLLRNPVEPDLTLHQSLRTFAGTFSGTFSGTLLNLTCFSHLLRNLRNLLRNSLNLTRRLHQCTPELFWAEDPISLRCWGKKRILRVPVLTNWWYTYPPEKYKFVRLEKIIPTIGENNLK